MDVAQEAHCKTGIRRISARMAVGSGMSGHSLQNLASARFFFFRYPIAKATIERLVGASLFRLLDYLTGPHAALT
ncbi:hypothetical protein E8F11_09265 [Pseudomonas sp. BN417]|uniref:hypothetical protein n=1 Tax=Pseudomonas sp. BN417 TaxID=2567890 RepID=UPI002454BFB1|nr:hypothetical protein [Pseudomonas sp. BN417]MDH4555364.1 hypothetical protein [Pseudomonas sp. BN417]